MPKMMKIITVLSFEAAIVATILFFFNKDIYLTLAITFGTTCYHLGLIAKPEVSFAINQYNFFTKILKPNEMFCGIYGESCKRREYRK